MRGERRGEERRGEERRGEEKTKTLITTSLLLCMVHSPFDKKIETSLLTQLLALTPPSTF